MFKNATIKLHPRTVDLSGNKFGRLTVQSFDEYRNVGQFSSAYWNVKCECGNEKSVQARFLKNGITVSCGCYQADMASERNRKPPGVAGFNRLFRSYSNGARHRGYEWELTRKEARQLFESPCHYCGLPPSQKSKSTSAKSVRNTDKYSEYTYSGIDRVNNNVGYVPSNCVACCKQCNYAKRSMNRREFLDLINRVYAHQNEN